MKRIAVAFMAFLVVLSFSSYDTFKVYTFFGSSLDKFVSPSTNLEFSFSAQIDSYLNFARFFDLRNVSGGLGLGLGYVHFVNPSTETTAPLEGGFVDLRPIELFAVYETAMLGGNLKFRGGVQIGYGFRVSIGDLKMEDYAQFEFLLGLGPIGVRMGAEILKPFSDRSLMMGASFGVDFDVFNTTYLDLLDSKLERWRVGRRIYLVDDLGVVKKALEERPEDVVIFEDDGVLFVKDRLSGDAAVAITGRWLKKVVSRLASDMRKGKATVGSWSGEWNPPQNLDGMVLEGEHLVIRAEGGDVSVDSRRVVDGAKLRLKEIVYRGVGFKIDSDVEVMSDIVVYPEEIEDVIVLGDMRDGRYTAVLGDSVFDVELKGRKVIFAGVEFRPRSVKSVPVVIDSVEVEASDGKVEADAGAWISGGTAGDVFKSLKGSVGGGRYSIDLEEERMEIEGTRKVGKYELGDAEFVLASEPYWADGVLLVPKGRKVKVSGSLEVLPNPEIGRVEFESGEILIKGERNCLGRRFYSSLSEGMKVKAVDALGNEVEMEISGVEKGEELRLELSYRGRTYEFSIGSVVVPDLSRMKVLLNGKEVGYVDVEAGRVAQRIEGVQVLDNDGNPLGDLKLASEAAEVEFSGGVLSVMNVTQRPGEYTSWRIDRVEGISGCGGELKGAFRLVVYPRKLSVRIDETVNASKVVEIERKLTGKDEAGNEVEVTALDLKDGEKRLELSGGVLRLKGFTRAGIERIEARPSRVVLKLGTVEYEYDASRVKVEGKVEVLPNVPVEYGFGDGMIKKVAVPAGVSVEGEMRAFDEFGNAVKEMEGSDLLKVSGGVARFKACPERGERTEELFYRMVDGSRRKFGELTVECVPVPKEIRMVQRELGAGAVELEIEVVAKDGTDMKSSVELSVGGMRKESLKVSGKGAAAFRFSGIGKYKVKAIAYPLPSDDSAVLFNPRDFSTSSSTELVVKGKDLKVEALVFERDLAEIPSGSKGLDPAVSPSGRYVAYVVAKAMTETEVEDMSFVVQNLRSGEKTVLMSGKTGRGRRAKEKKEVVYSYTWNPITDVLVYTPLSGEVYNISYYVPGSGDKGVLYESDRNDVDVSFSADGRVMVWSSGGNVMMARFELEDGRSVLKDISEIVKGGDFANIFPVVSPNGRYVVYSRNNVVYIYDTKSGSEKKLTKEDDSTFAEKEFSWSPDSRYVAFYRTTKQQKVYDLYVVEVESGKVVAKIEGVRDSFGPVLWIGNGKLVYAVPGKTDDLRIYEIGGSVRPLPTESAMDSIPILLERPGMFAAVEGGEVTIGLVGKAFTGVDTIVEGRLRGR